MVCGGQQMLRVDQEGSRPTDRALGDILQTVRGKLPTVDAMVLSDYAGGVLDAPQGMIARARRHSVPVYVDPKGPDWSRYCGATLIKPNEAELRAVVGDWEDGPDMVDRARRHLRLSGIEYALVTMGAGGMTLIDSGCTHWHQPATSGPVVDVTGAGDTVLACVAYLRSQGMDWPDVLRFAAMGAAAVCARHGTSAVTLADIDMVADDVC